MTLTLYGKNKNNEVEETSIHFDEKEKGLCTEDFFLEPLIKNSYDTLVGKGYEPTTFVLWEKQIIGTAKELTPKALREGLQSESIFEIRKEVWDRAKKEEKRIKEESDKTYK